MSNICELDNQGLHHTSYPIAGSIKNHINEWVKLTNDPTILNVVTGYKIEFSSIPVQSVEPRQSTFGANQLVFLHQELENLLAKGVVERSEHEAGEFISTVFLRPKKNGSFRMILNLKELNHYVVYHHFKMDGLDNCVNLITPGCYMASLDLSDAYYSVPIAKCSQKYLKFRVGEQLFHFTALPNGLSSGPRIFTKLMKPAFAKLRQIGHVSSGYLDDSFLYGCTASECAENIADSKDLLQDLGFHINEDKSVCLPTQVLPHLGFTLNSMDMTVSLGEDKVTNIKELGGAILSKHHRLSIRMVASFIGYCVSCFPGVEFGKLHYREMERDKSAALKMCCGNYDGPITLSQGAKQEIHWWLDNAQYCHRKISHSNADIVLQTDASTQGWGAKLLHGNSTGGRWSESEIDHINVLELKAAQLGLQALCCTVSDVHIQLQMDNVTAVNYIREMGGSHSKKCNEIANSIWNWCIEHGIWLSSTHIPGKANVDADSESRNFDDKTEWKLDPQAFAYCTELWGMPEIDLFASRLNFQCKPYVSWRPDPEAIAIDAFSLDWSNRFVYMFPPFSIIPRVLKKIREDSTRAILIAPQWPTQSWFPLLQRLQIDKPLLFRRSKALLTLPGRPGVTHPLYPKLRMCAYLLSGRGCKDKV